VREVDEAELKVFAEEFRENLEAMEDLIISLERDNGDPETLGSLFRHAHTLKGSSATLGFKAMAELTHKMEDVLDKARGGSLCLDHTVVGLLLEGVDCLRDMEGQLEASEALDDEVPVHVQDIIERLEELATEDREASTGFPSLQVDPGQLEEAHRDGLQAWDVSVQVSSECGLPSVRCFQVLMALGQAGEVVASVPTLEDIEGEALSDRLQAIVFSSEGDEAIRAAVLSVPEVSVVRVARLDRVAPGLVPAAKPRTEPGSRSRFRTVRVGVDVLDNLMNLVGELVIDRARLNEIQERFLEGDLNDSLRELSMTTGHLGRLATELQEEIMRARMLPVEALFRKFPRMVRDLAASVGKEIDFVMEGQDTELDRSMMEEISDPLIHILRNAVDHGIEPPSLREAQGKPARGRIRVSAEHREEHVVISVQDDGRGLDRQAIQAAAVSKGLVSEEAAAKLEDSEVFDLLFTPGFSTASKVTEVSGRGVGLDVVKKNVERLNGSVQVYSRPGEGSRFTLRLPLTLAIIRALLVRVEHEVYAIPLSSVVETQDLDKRCISTIQGREVITIRDRVLPLFRLANLVGSGQRPAPGGPAFVVVVWVGGRQAALLLDHLEGEQEVVIKTLGHPVRNCPGISGATILGQGKVAMILDVSGLLQASMRRHDAGAAMAAGQS